MQRIKEWFLIGAIAVAVFLVGYYVIPFFITDSSGAKNILAADGYKKIEITGYTLFGCSEDDIQHTGFVAEKNGHKINGVVCSGLLFKGSTIRIK